MHQQHPHLSQQGPAQCPREPSAGASEALRQCRVGHLENALPVPEDHPYRVQILEDRTGRPDPGEGRQADALSADAERLVGTEVVRDVQGPVALSVGHDLVPGPKGPDLAALEAGETVGGPFDVGVHPVGDAVEAVGDCHWTVVATCKLPGVPAVVVGTDCYTDDLAEVPDQFVHARSVNGLE
ncbi:MAG: hypothetical protein V5A18_07030 [Haloarculaceae archaeon]